MLILILIIFMYMILMNQGRKYKIIILNNNALG
jgi:hypothetical protein